MSNELDISYNGSATIYAIVRRVSDGDVWNGSTFGDWADGSIATYDIPLTSLGGDYYAVDFPSGITAAGTYRVTYYKRAGATPATTDLRLDTEEIYWTGSAVGEAPDGDDLVTLARVKEYLEITATTWDAKLQTLITAASRGVEAWCDRIFHGASYTEYRDGGSTVIRLRQYPVTALDRLATCKSIGLSVSNTTTTNQRATIAVDSSNLTLKRWASGTLTTNTLALATYPTLDELADAVDALGNGWTASTAYGDWASTELKTISGAANAKCGAELYLFDDELASYTLDEDKGLVYACFPRGIRNVRIDYTAGYSSIPDDLQQGVVSIIKAIHDISQVDSNMQSERIGDYEYSLKDQVASGNLSSSMFDDARFWLAKYRRIAA